MFNTTKKGSPQMQPLLIVLAAALRAPPEDLVRRRLPTLSYRYGQEQAQPKYDRRLQVPAPPRRACPPGHRAGARPVAWSSSRRSSASCLSKFEIMFIRYLQHPKRPVLHGLQLSLPQVKFCGAFGLLRCRADRSILIERGLVERSRLNIGRRR
jgi:hypothetical protein